MRKIDRDFLIELYELAEQEIKMHYSQPDEHGIRRLSMPNDRPIMQIKRKLVHEIVDKRKTNAPIEKIYQAAQRRLDGAKWSDIAEEFGEGFAKDLQGRYKEKFRFATASIGLRKQYLREHQA